MLYNLSFKPFNFFCPNTTQDHPIYVSIINFVCWLFGYMTLFVKSNMLGYFDFYLAQFTTLLDKDCSIK